MDWTGCFWSWAVSWSFPQGFEPRRRCSAHSDRCSHHIIVFSLSNVPKIQFLPIHIQAFWKEAKFSWPIQVTWRHWWYRRVVWSWFWLRLRPFPSSFVWQPTQEKWRVSSWWKAWGIHLPSIKATFPSWNFKSCNPLLPAYTCWWSWQPQTDLSIRSYFFLFCKQRSNFPECWSHRRFFVFQHPIGLWFCPIESHCFPCPKNVR